MEYKSYSPRETREIAAEMARSSGPGTVVCLNGDLGAGKTEFAKGFAKGLGIDELITSPTFTIVNEYLGGRLPLYHFDLYRITSQEQMQDTGYEDYFYGDGVCLAEWAELIKELVPRTAVWINIEKDLTISENFRLIKAGNSQ